jgi:serine protease AprX
LIRKSPSLVLLLTLSLLAPMAAAFRPVAHAQMRADVRRTPNKLTDNLRARARQARTGSSERERVILNLADETAKDRARQMLEMSGANVRQQLDSLGVMVADVPVDKLEELAASSELSWMSEDAEVRSLATVDNKSHIEVVTGADKVLPSNITQGGAGNGVGIAILDSGISPPDQAEFAGYKMETSGGLLGGGGLLGTGLIATPTVTPYNRIVQSVDFTGEGTKKDNYGHGTHTAGVAAGTGQASEDYAAQHLGAPTYGGIAPGAHLVSIRVLNSQGVGTVANVIAGIDWAIRNKTTYNIRVMNLSLGTTITQSYKTDPLCQAVGRAADAGIVVVVAAGNLGKDSAGQTIYGGILSPANSPKVITGGATNTQQTVKRSDDVVTTYSSRGPTLVDGIVKPDLVCSR